MRRALREDQLKSGELEALQRRETGLLRESGPGALILLATALPGLRNLAGVISRPQDRNHPPPRHRSLERPAKQSRRCAYAWRVRRQMPAGQGTDGWTEGDTR
jgi:hypothetical protein